MKIPFVKTLSTIRNDPAVSSFPALLVSAVLLGATGWGVAAGNGPKGFTRLLPQPSLKIVESTVAYAGGSYNVGNLIDGKERTEYSSQSQGTNTFVEFDFGRPTRIAAFRHLDRNDPATVAASELVFTDSEGRSVASVPVAQANRRAGVTFFTLPSPVTARRVRWRVTALGPRGFSTVGGAEIAFFAAGEREAVPRGVQVDAQALPMLERADRGPVRPLRLTVNYPYVEPVEAVLRIEGMEPKPVLLTAGVRTVAVPVPASSADRPLKITLDALGQTITSQTLVLKPVRKWEVYILPHSHVDIGYTALQTDVEKKQNDNIEAGLRLAKQTRNYPEGARFKWNVEVLWPVDNYLRQATSEERATFIAAVKSGSIGLDALYGNILTGLCRPEELVRMLSYATRLSDLCDRPIESAMISDVPGYTWSTVTALAQAGVRYFSFAPNYFDRMGGTMVTWQNKPFWWKGPDGRTRVLCWCPSRGYALGHTLGDGKALARFMPDYIVELENQGYPYDVTQVRWSVHGDNGSPDENVSEVVRDWNARHIYPRLIIATTATAFRELERRYGDQLPEYRGDYTPYWEDGAASSARETALNRASAERLVQAETLWVMRSPGPFPAGDFHEAWRNVLLYSEHTWGAHNSVSQPDVPFVRDQWKIKQNFALQADRQSRHLLAAAMGGGVESTGLKDAVDVFNTTGWPRTDLVTLTPDRSRAGDRVVDQNGQGVPSQRLSTGELVFLAQEVAPFSEKRFKIVAGSARAGGAAKAEGSTLVHPDYRIRIDEQTGAIASMQSRRAKAELVDSKAATALNDYFYLPGANRRDARRNGPPRITRKEKGPLVASLLIESDAPGCNRLQREVRVVDGLDRIEFINTVDKKPVRSKEGLHFGFGFNVPNGVLRMDVGWAVVRPELDQIPAACKNWFSVQRWVDIANDEYGLTWTSLDAPLVELGDLTGNLIGSQTDASVWIQHLEPSQTLYSWVMNNHWHTNYRAEQEGATVFRYAIRAHRGYSPLQAARFGQEYSQPLLVAPAMGQPSANPPLVIEPASVQVTALKPSDDGQAWIVRLFGAAGQDAQARIIRTKPGRGRTWLSDTSEKPVKEVGNTTAVPAWGMVTLRMELP